MQDLLRLCGCALLLCAQAASGAEGHATMPRYEHILVIIAENKGASTILGNPSAAPELNRLANTYGVATHFYGEVHPSEGNYVAMLGGDTFGIHDDDAFYCRPDTRDPYCRGAGSAGYADHTVRATSLMDQLEARHLTWKGYLQNLPEPGSKAIFWPAPGEPVAGVPARLYAAKHNGFLNFEHVQKDPALAEKLVDFDALERDLASGHLPAFAHIVPNQCNDMHGLAPSPATEQDCAVGPDLIRRGDRFIGELVARIMRSPAWDGRGNNAIVITFDESDHDAAAGDQGCCGYQPGSLANYGGGPIPTIVITNHGPRGVIDPTPYNHYSLLRTIEEAFGIGQYIGHAADDGQGVRAMTPLFSGRAR